MKALSLAVLFVASSLMATPVASTFNNDLQLYVVTEEVATPSDLNVKLQSPSMSRGDELDSANVIFDKLVNLGKKMWALVEANKPAVNVSYMYANALPQGVRNSEDLESFSELQSRSFRTYAKNLYGVTVYDLTYSIIHRYGGSYQGRGKYLENVAVIPSNLDVVWGYTVDYKVDKVSVVNSGTKESPVASILLETNFKVSTIMQSSETHSVYDFRGDRAEVKRVEK